MFLRTLPDSVRIVFAGGGLYPSRPCHCAFNLYLFVQLAIASECCFSVKLGVAV